MDKNNPLFKKALLLEYLTIGWNIFEGVSTVAVGLLSGSIALVAYGLESGVEVFASSLVVWELKDSSKKREAKVLKWMGYAYLVISAFIFIDTAKSLFEGHHPDKSILGISLLFITAIVMFSLGYAKRSVGSKLGSPTVIADAKFTLIDGALASTVLIGLAFNVLFGWWWMDQALALFLSGVAFREGIREVLN